MYCRCMRHWYNGSEMEINKCLKHQSLHYFHKLTCWVVDAVEIYHIAILLQSSWRKKLSEFIWTEPKINIFHYYPSPDFKHMKRWQGRRLQWLILMAEYCSANPDVLMSVLPVCDVIMSFRAASLKNESVRGRGGSGRVIPWCNSEKVPWPFPAAPERFFPQRRPSPDALPAGERERVMTISLISPLHWFDCCALHRLQDSFSCISFLKMWKINKEKIDKKNTRDRERYT